VAVSFSRELLFEPMATFSFKTLLKYLLHGPLPAQQGKERKGRRGGKKKKKKRGGGEST